MQTSSLFSTCGRHQKPWIWSYLSFLLAEYINGKGEGFLLTLPFHCRLSDPSKFLGSPGSKGHNFKDMVGCNSALLGLHRINSIELGSTAALSMSVILGGNPSTFKLCYRRNDRDSVSNSLNHIQKKECSGISNWLSYSLKKLDWLQFLVDRPYLGTLYMHTKDRQMANQLHL